jgi:hypothetical protein
MVGFIVNIEKRKNLQFSLCSGKMRTVERCIAGFRSLYAQKEKIGEIKFFATG